MIHTKKFHAFVGGLRC